MSTAQSVGGEPPPAQALPQQRIGILGGAFDPPHNAHVAMAQAALQQLQLDHLLVLPTGQAWHKSRSLSPAAQRVAMTELAFASMARVQVDARETLREGPTYSIDTLQALRHEHPGAEFFLIIGQDQAERFATWHRAAEIAAGATICVAARALSTGVPGLLTPQIVLQNGPLSAPNPAQIGLQLPWLPVSATEIRQRVAKGQNVAHLVPEAVARYIEHHSLYKTT